MQSKHDSEWLLEQLTIVGAFIRNSHLVLTSGKHSSGYVNLRCLGGHTDVLSGIAEMVSDSVVNFETWSGKADAKTPVVIVGPETLGRTLAEFTAVTGKYGFFAWCEMKKDTNGDDFAEWSPKMSFQEIIKGARCYIVDDLLTTAKSVKLVKRLIEESGGQVNGIVVIVRRSQNVTAGTIGVPWLHALLDVSDFDIHNPDTCPLCANKVPMVLRPGHGHEWISSNEGYPIAE